VKLTNDQISFLEDKVEAALKIKTGHKKIVAGFADFLESLEPEIVDPSTVKVKYIGRRPFYEHREFGQWTADMVKSVPAMLAAKMLKHADVYVKAEPGEVATEKVDDKPAKVREDDDERLHNLRDTIIQSRFKQPIVDTIKANFNQHDITRELDVDTAKVADYQRVALAHIDFVGLEGLT
jgi:hypothetical protein